MISNLADDGVSLPLNLGDMPRLKLKEKGATLPDEDGAGGAKASKSSRDGMSKSRKGKAAAEKKKKKKKKKKNNNNNNNNNTTETPRRGPEPRNTTETPRRGPEPRNTTETLTRFDR